MAAAFVSNKATRRRSRHFSVCVVAAEGTRDGRGALVPRPSTSVLATSSPHGPDWVTRDVLSSESGLLRRALRLDPAHAEVGEDPGQEAGLLVGQVALRLLLEHLEQGDHVLGALEVDVVLLLGERVLDHAEQDLTLGAEPGHQRDEARGVEAGLPGFG